MHLGDPLSPWFSMSDKFSPTAVGSPPSYDLSLLQEDHVNNHVYLGVPPPKHGYMNPVSSRGHPSQIRRYRALHPGQLSARSSRGLVLAPDQLSIGSNWGHPPQIRRYRAFTLVNSLPGQVKVLSLHLINSPSGQVGVTPCKSEGIEPFTMVNSPPCQVGVTPQSRRYRALHPG